MVYTSAINTACQRTTYITESNGVLIAHVESPGCCILVDNFDASDKNEVHYTIGPLSGASATCPLQSEVDGSMKILTKTGTGDSLCLLVAICQPGYSGINVMCRSQPPLLIVVYALLGNLLAAVLGPILGPLAIPNLQTVSQNCVIPSDNCPT